MSTEGREPVSPTADTTGVGTRPASADTAGVIAPPPLIYLGALAIGFGLDAAFGFGSLSAAVAVPVGCALMVAGGVLAVSFVKAFQRSDTPLDPYTPSVKLVTDGPYRFTRNPGYLGMALACAGIAVVSDALWALVPIVGAVAVIDRGVIAREERYLERKFGAQYNAYRARVRRWL
jgi:protein-S-isoprenylcysteine O-methyltransferase Ste14